MSRAFAFLDRDGTLIEDREYAYRLEDCVPLPGAMDAVRDLRAAGLGVAVVTNQSGIGRGYFSVEECERFHAHLRAEFAAGGAPLDAVYLCPHAPEAGCACRKPATGLLERARDELGADLEASWVVGNRPSDVGLAGRAGCRAVYVLTGGGALYRDAVEPAVRVEPDLLGAARHITAIAGRSP